MEPKSVLVEEHDYYYAEAGESVEQVEEKLKKKISCHALYGLLVETHLECLKVCLGEVGNVNGVLHTSEEEVVDRYKPRSCMANKTELDHFMETYCMVLRKLKEAMEKQQLESVAFINNMHSQLKELVEDTTTSTSATTSPVGDIENDLI